MLFICQKSYQPKKAAQSPEYFYEFVTMMNAPSTLGKFHDLLADDIELKKFFAKNGRKISQFENHRL